MVERFAVQVGGGGSVQISRNHTKRQVDMMTHLQTQPWKAETRDSQSKLTRDIRHTDWEALSQKIRWKQ